MTNQSVMTPRKSGVGPLQNFVSLDAPESNVRSSRDAIKGELANKLIFDDPRVFDRYLGIVEVPSPLVDACADNFEAANHHAIGQLQMIIGAANPRSLDDLEALERDDEGVQRKVKREERKMYPHLRTLFKYIESFSLAEQPPLHSRQFVETNSTTLTVEAHTWGFPNASPDFTLLDMPESTVSVTGSKVSTLWRHRGAFAEIKPTSKQGPKPSDPHTVLPIVTQCADYARLHLSARPFQLYSIGLMIFGFQFCVAVFDRDGVLFSPIRDILRDKATFIRVVRRLACDMTSVQLGQDPTVSMIPHEKSVHLRARAKSLTGTDTFPCFSITMGGSDTRRWYTLGPPIWTSISLLGRGTSVWRVCEANNFDDVLVLKSAWRSSKRTAESDIYKSIAGPCTGIALYRCGMDVMFPDDSLITVANLRGDTPGEAEPTPVLHRLLLATLGRPLWEYSSDVELLKGLRAAVKGHQHLFELGILHRDISAGNILLSAGVEPEEGCEGFLMDLEFAHVSSPSLNDINIIRVAPLRHPSGHLTNATTRTHIKFDKVAVQHGAAMTGTAQFMAIEILDGIARKKNVNHQVHHDLESFVWVMCYSVTRRLVLTSKKTDSMDGDGRAALHKFFYTNFGRMDIRSIAMARRSLDALLLPQTFHELVPQPMSSLYDALYDHVQQSILRKNPTPLSHKILLAEFDKTIEMMMSVNIETCVGGATDYVGLNSRRIIPSVGHLPGTPK